MLNLPEDRDGTESQGAARGHGGPVRAGGLGRAAEQVAKVEPAG